ncbi:hypothetical protein M409DRAFT_29032 [Zasmidium cellare ATCC 36951]|uniref:Cytochrome P450 n=1 Tax=Zasmidium cellare ATCC 36951 TaxID=1080233 RepID=A0A6A6C0R4_ZASCE|nr:uncharacterized protein M409DRAFT_29032 [Zasmidium cellare ATCC 36951]KAF2160647.1 hypothetical protein M409DRAFT_29032 [Zasmidium cellare ATCC 36951]
MANELVIYTCLALATIACVRLVYTYAYNVYLHPLREVPGPFWAKVITNYISHGSGCRAQNLLRLHKAFGYYVRIGPNEVSIADPDLYRTIYSQTTSIKPDTFYQAAKMNHEHIFSLSIENANNYLAGPFVYGKDNYLGRGLTNDEALEEAMGLAFAGSGTTATTILYIIYQLSHSENRGIQLKLRQELQRAPLRLIELRNLVYLNAIINEGMRLHPAIVGSLPRTLLESLEITLGTGLRVILPPGTTVCMQNYVHQQDALAYPDPDEFRPERWLEQPSSSKASQAFTPFSTGSRNCIGQSLAKAEILLAVGCIFRQLDFQLSGETTPGDMEMLDLFAADISGKKLVVEVTKPGIETASGNAKVEFP